MKKNVLALGIAAMVGGLGFAGAASANVIVGTGDATTVKTAVDARLLSQATATGLQVADGGVGHALVVPYFNAQNGNSTVLHLTNTDTFNGKVVKVRFRSAANSDDLLDFQVFLSPGDVWTGAVAANGTDGATLVSADNTCTVPALTKGVAVPFGTSRLAGYLSDDDKKNQTREGYVEIFNMADITNAASWNAEGQIVAGGTRLSPLYQATKHVNAVAPCSVAGSPARTLVDSAAVNDYTEQAAADTGLQTPTGGLMADWYILNVAQTTTFSGGATAIQATGGNGRANFVHFPQINQASTAVANNTTADPLFRTADVYNAAGAAVTSASIPLNHSDLPDMSTPYLAADAALGANGPRSQANRLTQALAVRSVTNQYANDAIIAAKTDWLFSMPTRRYNVAANYAAVTSAGAAAANANYRVFTNLNTVAVSQANNWFYPAATGAIAAGGGTFRANGNTSVDAKGNICVLADAQRFWDREETTSGVIPEFSPGGTTSVQFCGEVSVLAFQDTGTSVLGASVARTTATRGTYENGWGVLTTTNAGMGLPLVGASFIKLANPAARPGVSGTYGVTWPHRFTR